METYKKEISFLSQVLVGEQFESQEVKKVATFKELSRTDKDQHKLHFMLVSIFKSNGNDEMKLDSDQLYDITVKAISSTLITDENFTEQDKMEFLGDGGALIQFGMWLLADKISPFFSALMRK